MNQSVIALALQHHAAGHVAEAEALYRQIVAEQPGNFAAYSNLGALLAQSGRPDQAIAAWRQALAINPDYPVPYNNLGHTLNALGRKEEAAASLRRALELRPDYAEAHNNLGVVLMSQGHFDAAVAAFRTAGRLKPDDAHAFSNLGNCLKDCGQTDEAIAAYRRALALQPRNATMHSNLVYTLHFHAGYDAPSLLRELRQWDAIHAAPLKATIRPHTNDPTANRRLRVGYVSSDFRRHVVGQNLLPLLREHDRRGFEVFCYSSVGAPDWLTDRCRERADVWREIFNLNDDQAAEMIRNDRIDILVDLALHSGNNRLLIFARKPAPVQVTYLGYCASTGMEAMDYRLSDPYLDPPETDLSCYSEQTIRLPETYWCYLPPDAAIEPAPAPVLRAGHVTFGCLNNLAKVSLDALRLWAEILGAVEGSRLLLHTPSEELVDSLRERLKDAGIAPERVEFVGKQTWVPYAQTYARIDIALDPFPYGGGITTFDALWMGVAVVTLSGKTAVGRGGRSILSNLGLPELIGYTPEEYRQIAVDLAGDIPRLTALRGSLRQRMLGSPIMDAGKFARGVEGAYREMWRRWCEARRKGV